MNTEVALRLSENNAVVAKLAELAEVSGAEPDFFLHFDPFDRRVSRVDMRIEDNRYFQASIGQDNFIALEQWSGRGLDYEAWVASAEFFESAIDQQIAELAPPARRM